MLTVPSYRVVNYKYPIQEDNPIGIAYGYAFDRALLECNYHRLSIASTLQYFKNEFLKMLDGHPFTQDTRQQILQQASMMFLAYKNTAIYKNSLLRPKTRVVVINNTIGVYMQPDFYDPIHDVFYEVKSFSLRKDEYIFKRICYQVKLYQLAYSSSKAMMLGFGNNNNSNGNSISDKVNYELLELPPLRLKEKVQLLQDILTAVNSLDIQEEDDEVVLCDREAVFYGLEKR